MRETGKLLGDEKEAEINIEEAVDLFLTFYEIVKQGELEELSYTNIKNEWDGFLDMCGEEPSTDEEFEQFIMEQLGQEEYSLIMESR